MEIPNQNIKDLYAHFLNIGRVKEAENLLIRFPSLKEAPKEELKEVKKDDKVRKR